MKRFTDWWVFQLERLLLRGAQVRLLLMALAIVAVSVTGGVALVLIGAPEGPLDAMWWAFLRLTDPGYLGDDEGLARRILSTLLTIAGYVLFMGALIAILTEWLHRTVAWLQRGETPLVRSGHIVVLGLTPRTSVIIEELLRSEDRVRRLLPVGRGRRLVVVALVHELDEDIRAGLASQLGKSWNDQQVILRSGTPLIEEHLLRVDFAHAAAILVPGPEGTDATPAERDAGTLKTVLSLANHPAIRESAHPPRIIAEIADARLLGVVHAAYAGSLVLLPTQRIASRLLAQNLRHRGLSYVLAELLAFHTGNDLYFKPFAEAAGQHAVDVLAGVRGGLCLGLVREDAGTYAAYLNPPRDLVVRADDRFVVIARTWEGISYDGPEEAPEPLDAPPRIVQDWPRPRRILAMGWGGRARLLLHELETYADESFEVDLLSVIPIEEREAELARAGWRSEHVALRHLVGDYVDLQDVRAQDLSRYDNLVILGRDWLEEGEDADSQTVLGALIVRAELAGLERRPSVLVELMDPDNARLFDAHPGEVILSPEVMGRMMAHVAVRPELQAVLDELFTVGGAEMHFRPARHYGLGQETVRFGDLRRAAAARGEIALGLRIGTTPIDVAGELELAPDDDATFDLDEHALILVLTTY
mgnify:CR=1 FL=1